MDICNNFAQGNVDDNVDSNCDSRISLFAHDSFMYTCTSTFWQETHKTVVYICAQSIHTKFATFDIMPLHLRKNCNKTLRAVKRDGKYEIYWKKRKFL